jgi:hypothetical protein
MTAAQIYAADSTSVPILAGIAATRIFPIALLGVVGSGTGYTTLQVLLNCHSANYATINYSSNDVQTFTPLASAAITSTYDLTDQAWVLYMGGTKSLTPTASITWTLLYVLA